jgi:ketopantoate hydroxymethyltransferase
MHAAFRRGGRKAIEKVMRNQPAVFLKLLVLLVPREMKLEHSGGVKAMTDEQLERGIELIDEMLAQREAGANAKVIEGVSEEVKPKPKPKRPKRKPVATCLSRVTLG